MSIKLSRGFSTDIFLLQRLMLAAMLTLMLTLK
jgi:hypothetical protein